MRTRFREVGRPRETAYPKFGESAIAKAATLARAVSAANPTTACSNCDARCTRIRRPPGYPGRCRSAF